MQILQKSARYLAAFSAGLAVSALFSIPLAAQRPACLGTSVRRCSIPVIVQEFAREQATGVAGGAATFVVGEMLVPNRGYPAVRVDSLVDALEVLALTGHPWAGGAAVTRLGTGAGGRPGMATRLIRIYRRQSDPLVRQSVMGALRHVRDRQAAVQLLGEVVLEDPFEESTEWAILHLSLMGEVGAAKLRELHRSGRVRNGFAQSALDRLSRTNYRHKDGRP